MTQKTLVRLFFVLCFVCCTLLLIIGVVFICCCVLLVVPSSSTRSKSKAKSSSSIFVVTPHHSQRMALRSALRARDSNCVSDTEQYVSTATFIVQQPMHFLLSASFRNQKVSADSGFVVVCDTVEKMQV